MKASASLTIEPGYDRLCEIKELFREYQTTLGLDLCFQNFEEELADLPGKYAGPDGRLYLACLGGMPAGCIALRKFDGSVCEMKRLYVKKRFRGNKVGKALVERIIADASEIGYDKMVLDTYKDIMREAVALYRGFGFTETRPYYDNPHEGVLFLELDLRGSSCDH